MNWQNLDQKMLCFAPRLVSQVKVTPEIAGRLAATIAADVRFLSPDDKERIREASPVALQHRLAELTAHEGWLNYSRAIPSPLLGEHGS